MPCARARLVTYRHLSPLSATQRHLSPPIAKSRTGIRVYIPSSRGIEFGSWTWSARVATRVASGSTVC